MSIARVPRPRDAARSGRAADRARASLLALAALSAVVAAVAAPPPPSASSDEQTLSISSDLQVRVLRGRDLEILVLVAGGDGYATIADRVGRGAEDAAALAAWNGGGEPPGRELGPRPGQPALGGLPRAGAANRLSEGPPLGRGLGPRRARRARCRPTTRGCGRSREWFTGRGDDVPRADAGQRTVLAGAPRRPGRSHPAPSCCTPRSAPACGLRRRRTGIRLGRAGALRGLPAEGRARRSTPRWSGDSPAGPRPTTCARWPSCCASAAGSADLRDIPVGYLDQDPAGPAGAAVSSRRAIPGASRPRPRADGAGARRWPAIRSTHRARVSRASSSSSTPATAAATWAR